MSLERVVQSAGTAVLVLWVIGVSGHLGTSPWANWTLFAAGVALVVVGPVGGRFRRRSSAPAADRP
jgi:hypothetical protein